MNGSDAAFASTPSEYRMVVTLCLVEGFSYREAADALDIPIGTVMSRLHRGRRHLQAKLLAQAREQGLGSAEGKGPAEVDEAAGIERGELHGKGGLSP